MDEMIAANIKFYRNKLAWTQEHLAAACNVNVRTIQRAEDGHHISSETLAAIAGAFDISVDDLRKLPKEAEEITGRYKVIELQKIEQAADLRHLMGAGAFHFDHTGVADADHQQAIAEFHQELHDCGEMWTGMEPLHRYEALAALEGHVSRLHAFELVIGAATEELRLRLKQGNTEPFTMEVLRVLVSPASEPKLFLLRDKTAPVSFG